METGKTAGGRDGKIQGLEESGRVDPDEPRSEADCHCSPVNPAGYLQKRLNLSSVSASNGLEKRLFGERVAME
jgi:hypothetical protein